MSTIFVRSIAATPFINLIVFSIVLDSSGTMTTNEETTNQKEVLVMPSTAAARPQGRNGWFEIYLNPYDPLSRLASTVWNAILPEQFPINSHQNNHIGRPSTASPALTTEITVTTPKFSSAGIVTDHQPANSSDLQSQVNSSSSPSPPPPTLGSGVTQSPTKPMVVIHQSTFPPFTQSPTGQHSGLYPRPGGSQTFPNGPQQRPPGPNQQNGPLTQPGSQQQPSNMFPQGMHMPQQNLQMQPYLPQGPGSGQIHPGLTQGPTGPAQISGNPAIPQQPRPEQMSPQDPSQFPPGNPNNANIPSQGQSVQGPFMTSSSQQYASSFSNFNTNPQIGGRPLGTQPFYPPSPNSQFQSGLPGQPQQYAPQQQGFQRQTKPPAQAQA